MRSTTLLLIISVGLAGFASSFGIFSLILKSSRVSVNEYPNLTLLENELLPSRTSIKNKELSSRFGFSSFIFFPVTTVDFFETL